MLRNAVAVSIVLASLAARGSVAGAEGEKPPTGYWSLTLSGGAAFPLADYADAKDSGLAAHAALAYTGKSGLGIGLDAGYSPLPEKVADAATAGATDNHVVYSALAPRFTLGRHALRLFVGAGGGVYLERAAEARTEPAALAQAGLELHVLGAGGLTLGGSYLRSFADAAAQLASAHAGFVLTF